VSLGLPTSTSRLIAVDLMSEITRQHKKISLEIVEGATADLADLVARQRLDLTIAVDIQESTKFDVYPLLIEELLLVGPAASPLSSPAKLDDICELPLVLPSFPNSVRVKMERACIERGLQYQVIAETAAASVLAGVARAGLAWTILPWSALKVETDLLLKSVEIEGHILNRTLSLCVSKAAASNSACAIVKHALIRLIEQRIESQEWHYATLLR
jgi:LysR family transcriptional regulator, nitrogen assimilation regulatory protein